MSRLNRPLRVWHGLLAAVAALAVGSAGSAIAGGQRDAISPAAHIKAAAVTLHYVHKERTVHASSQAGLHADCPPGTYVVGGGVFSSAHFAHGGGMMINSSTPFNVGDPDNDGWFGKVDNFQNAEAKSMTVYAICMG